MPPKSPDEERALITRNDSRRPYGAKVLFQILNSASIGELDNVTLLLNSGAIATISPARSASWETGQRFQVVVEGFQTARVAEEEGLRLAQTLLLCAVSMNFGLRLNYQAHEPATVFERFRSTGDSSWAEGVVGWSQPAVIAELLSSPSGPLLNRALLLSMELYCAAFLEPNERARFVTIVSALEPLAEQMDLGSGVQAFVSSMVKALDEVSDIDPQIRKSLKGRISQLKKESVRQALLRLCDTWFPQRPDVKKRIDRAYALRSELLHEGTLLDPDTDIRAEIDQISRVLREIFQQASGWSFRVPTKV